MFLSAAEISAEVKCGRLVIEPFVPELLKPASYVLRVSDRWRQWRATDGPINIWSGDSPERHLGPIIQSSEFDIPPLGFTLASTIELVGLPDDLIGVLSTLSHLARFGLCVHLNSCFVSPGFGNRHRTALALEIASVNPSPIRLSYKMPVCHLAFAKTSHVFKSIGTLSKSAYEGTDPLSAPKLYEEFQFLRNSRS